jgi:hypothetical protein
MFSTQYTYDFLTSKTAVPKLCFADDIMKPRPNLQCDSYKNTMLASHHGYSGSVPGDVM